MSRFSRKRTRQPTFSCRTCHRSTSSLDDHQLHASALDVQHDPFPHVTYPPRRGEAACTTRRLKRQHRKVMMSLKAWARYISKGTGPWSLAARAWLARKAGR